MEMEIGEEQEIYSSEKTGLTLVDQGGKKNPDLEKDFFWNDDHVAPLYSVESAKRTVHPLIGSASGVNLVKNIKTITMIPHKSKLSKMDEETQQAHVRLVSVEEHNSRHKSQRKIDKVSNPNDSLMKVRKRNKNVRGENYNGMSMATRNVPVQLEGAAKSHQVHATNSMPRDISWPIPSNDVILEHIIDGPNFRSADSRPPTSGSFARSGMENPQRNNSEKRLMTPSSAADQYSPYFHHSSQQPRHPSLNDNEDISRGLRRY